MSIQDRLERILRDLLIMVSKAPAAKAGKGYVLIHKKEMQQQLSLLRDVVQEMMDQYEATEESRNRGRLEAKKQQDQIIRNANHQAQDIYAASVLYTEDALGKIQSIIDEAEQASKDTLDRLRREMEEERRRVRSNQNELLIQLEDLKDTAKYMRLIEERNREIAKAKAKKEERLKPRRYGRKPSEDSTPQQEGEEETFTPIRPEIRVNTEYLRKAGYLRDDSAEELPPEELSDENFTDMQEDPSEALAAEIIAGIAREISADLPAEAENPERMEKEHAAAFNDDDDKIEYEKPVIKVNPEYFEKIKKQNSTEKNETAKEDAGANEKKQGRFSFGRKS